MAGRNHLININLLAGNPPQAKYLNIGIKNDCGIARECTAGVLDHLFGGGTLHPVVQGGLAIKLAAQGLEHHGVVRPGLQRNPPCRLATGLERNAGGQGQLNINPRRQLLLG